MTIEQIKKKTIYGDYTTLGMVIGVNAPAAKARFLRGNKMARTVLTRIIEDRDRLIVEFQEKIKNEKNED